MLCRKAAERRGGSERLYRFRMLRDGRTQPLLAITSDYGLRPANYSLTDGPPERCGYCPGHLGLFRRAGLE